MDESTSAEIHQSGLKTGNNIFPHWQLNDTEQHALLTINVTFFRLSRILNVYKLLRAMWVPLRVANWLRTPNDHFKGKSALEVISETHDGLEKVQQYLKYEFQDLEE